MSISFVCVHSNFSSVRRSADVFSILAALSDKLFKETKRKIVEQNLLEFSSLQNNQRIPWGQIPVKRKHNQSVCVLLLYV